MSKLFLTNINLNTNELQFPVIHKLGTPPTAPAPVSGQMYFNSTDNHLYIYDGAAWDKVTLSGEIVNADIKSGAAIDKAKINGTAITAGDTGTVTSTMIANSTIINEDISGSAGIELSKLAVNPLARSAHTGTQTAATISDLATTVQGYTLNQFAVPTVDLNLNSRKITALADPTLPQDAATKNYVDATSQGLDVKSSVRVATTGNIVLSGAQTIDTVSVVALNRVLVKNQTNGAENGIWVAQTGAWTRATDADNGTKLTSGAFVFVEDGSVSQRDTGWVLSTDTAIVVGTTAQVWSQFSGAGQIDAGNGLTKNGNVIDVVSADAGRIVVGVNSIDLATVANPQTGGSLGTTFVQSVTTDNYGRVTTVTNGTRKFAGPNPLLTLAGGVGTWTVTHNLGASDVIAQVRQISNNEVVDADVEFTSNSVITVRLNAPAPATNIAADSYRIVVLA